MAAILYLEKQENGLRLKIISRSEALKLQHALKHPELVTDEAQQAKLARIQEIYLGRTTKPAQSPQMPDTSHLTHEGIYQSMDSAIPRNDR